jgi:hypothetical protein
LIISALSGFIISVYRLSKSAIYREQAFQIAEAGNEYYRWHLAHAKMDYQDGTGVPGPYAHDFYDFAGNLLGQFILTITPPPIGSTLVKIKSEGASAGDTGIKRIIETSLAIPSFAKYAVAANDMMRFGEGTVVWGPIQSNNGIHFDGLAHNIISSSKASYDDPDHSGGLEFGVHTHINPWESSVVSPVPNRPDIFMSGRQFPVPALDFAGITTDLSEMKASAISGGRYFGSSGRAGYRILLLDNGTFNLYRVRTLESPGGSCSDPGTPLDWGSWSIDSSRETFLGNYANPANGVIFVEDNLWVEGKIKNSRLTIAVGVFPDNVSTRRSITVNNNLLYTNYDGTDSIGLIAQKDINVGMISANNLRIDAAIIAQNGRAGRFYYGSGCSPYDHRNSLTLYGMIATNQRYGFAYIDNFGHTTGYTTRDLIYDGNLLYAPPPNFPLTADQYSIVFWNEVR